jgi:hypothetical protein
MDNYYISAHKLVFEAGNVVEFESTIQKTLAIDRKIIVLLHSAGNAADNRNIFAVNFNGDLLWQIEKSLDLDIIGDCPFVGIEINKAELVCYNWCGFRFTADPATGQITSRVFTR